MVVSQGDIWWTDLGPARGSAPAYRRPVLVVQGDAFNRSRIATVVCVALTSNVALAAAPGNVLLEASSSGLTRDSVANVSQVLTVDRRALAERAGRISVEKLRLVFAGLDVVLGR